MKRVGTVILVGLIALFVYIAYEYISYRTKNAVSDAAFVRTDSLLTLSFKVDGKVDRITKQEGQEIKKGELLATMETKDFEVALEGVKRNVEAVRKKKEALEVKRATTARSLDVQMRIAANDKTKALHDIKSFSYEIAADEVRLQKLGKDLRRYRALYAKKLVQKERLEAIQSAYESLKKGIEAKRSRLEGLKVAVKNLDEKMKLLRVQKEGLKELDHQIEALEKEREALEAKEADLKNKIAYCFMYAPIDGSVAKRFINEDRVIEAGSPVLSVVDPKDLHIEVLLSEKKLEGVKEGNEVKIEVDAFKDRLYHGKVERILPASAATFALVPRDIASGEFTKLDQRFVVRITIDDPTPDLRVGMGASVAIKRD
ncbi:MAG: hypothetical protein C6H99_00140 [Epsilonproteobacteria bacterium]|nr:hypothetical protein [Campylobacterota bacterium]NPA64611.1 HlyD family efflux transporter periplasmic adaptor subunit [Campylobacterota bacterium]